MTSTRLALGLPEILSEILSHLPIPDLLLRARPVDRYWQQVVDTSPKTLWATWRSPHMKKSHDIELHAYLLDRLHVRLPTLSSDRPSRFIERFLSDWWSMGGNLDNKIKQQNLGADRTCKGCGEPCNKCAVHEEALHNFRYSHEAWDIIADRFILSKFTTVLKSTYITRPPLKKMKIRSTRFTVQHLNAKEASMVFPCNSNVNDLVIEDERGITFEVYLRQLGHWYVNQGVMNWQYLVDLYLLRVNGPVYADDSEHEAEFGLLFGGADDRRPLGGGKRLPPNNIAEALRYYALMGIENKCGEAQSDEYKGGRPVCNLRG